MVPLPVAFDINVPFLAKDRKIKTVKLPPCFYIELSFGLDIVSFQRLIHYVFERAGLIKVINLPGTHQFRVGRRDMNYSSQALAGDRAGQFSDLSQLDPVVILICPGMAGFPGEKLNPFYYIYRPNRSIVEHLMLKLFAKDSREIKGQIVDRLDISGSGGNRDMIPELFADNRPQLLPGNDPDQHRFITLFHDLENISSVRSFGDFINLNMLQYFISSNKLPDIPFSMTDQYFDFPHISLAVKNN